MKVDSIMRRVFAIAMILSFMLKCRASELLDRGETPDLTIEERALNAAVLAARFPYEMTDDEDEHEPDNCTNVKGNEIETQHTGIIGMFRNLITMIMGYFGR